MGFLNETDTWDCAAKLYTSSGSILFSKLVKEDENFKVTVTSILDEVTPSTKIIYLANPNNPTGSVMNEKEMKEIVKIVMELNLTHLKYLY